MTESKSALQLRYLQTLNAISAEKNSTIIFPLPIEFLSTFMNHDKSSGGQKSPSEKKKLVNFDEWSTISFVL
jgi:erythrocyte band 7 integral membrane protein